MLKNLVSKNILTQKIFCSIVNGIILQKEIKMVRGEYDKFPELLRIGPFIDSTHMKL